MSAAGRPWWQGRAAVAGGQAGVRSRLDRHPPDLTTTGQCREFVLAHTRPGDRLVLGPPFILVAAAPALPGGRACARVVPMDYYLEPFDRETFVRDIRARCDVYLGEAEWFDRPVWVRPAEPDNPVFARSEVTRASFRGAPVIVARQRP